MRFRFIFIVFYCTAILIFSVYLRSSQSRSIYMLCKYSAEQSRLKQRLGKKQLRLEELISPSSLWKLVNENKTRPEN